MRGRAAAAEEEEEEEEEGSISPHRLLALRRPMARSIPAIPCEASSPIATSFSCAVNEKWNGGVDWRPQ
jgi:hypothetical protein